MLVDATEKRILHATPEVTRLSGLKAGDNRFAAMKAALKIISRKANERIILLLSCQGKTAAQIAEIMNVSIDTEKGYRKQIFKKLYVVSMPQAISVATFFRLI